MSDESYAEGCQALTKAGTRCQQAPKHGQTLCRFHSPDPEVQAEVHAARMKGAATTARLEVPVEGAPVPDFTTMGSTRAFLQEVARVVASGQMASRQGATLTGLANAALKTLEADQSVQIAHLRARVDAILKRRS